MYNKTITSAVLLLSTLIGGNSQASVSEHHERDLISRVEFQNSSRKIWSEHAIWTRLFLVSANNDSEDKSPVWQRLLKVQTDHANVFKQFYGEDSGNKLAALLTEQVNITSNLIGFLQENKDVEVATTKKMLQENFDSIAVFLSTANPEAWPLDKLKEKLNAIMESTNLEIKEQIDGDYAGSIAAFDDVLERYLMFADYVSAGIMKQFPDKFTPVCACFE